MGFTITPGPVALAGDPFVSGTLTASGQSLTLSSPNALGTVSVQITALSGSGVSLFFESSMDGTNWRFAYLTPDAPASGRPTVSPAAQTSWTGTPGAANYFRLRCSAGTSVSVTAVMRATQSAPTANVQAVQLVDSSSGSFPTVTTSAAGIGASAPALAVSLSPGNNTVTPAGDITATGGVSTVGATVTATATSWQNSFTAKISNAAGWTFNFEMSTDGTNWQAIPFFDIGQNAVAPFNGFNNQGGAYCPSSNPFHFAGNCPGAIGLRAKVYATNTGTASIYIRLSQANLAGLPAMARPPLSFNASPTAWAASTTDRQLMSQNAARFAGSLYNDSTSILYLLMGTGTTSTTNHSVQMAANSYLELPAGYCGPVRGFHATATGFVRVSEYTAQ